MTAAQEIERLYADFAGQFRAQNAERGLGQGIFGMGVGPGDLPCHRQLFDNLKELLADIAGRGVSSGELRGALEVIFREPVQLRGSATAAYWTLMAAQGCSLDVIGRLDAADAAALYARYKKDYPRSQRLPVQNQVLNALGKRAKTG